jgi:hypothetical protein
LFVLLERVPRREAAFALSFVTDQFKTLHRQTNATEGGSICERITIVVRSRKGATGELRRETFNAVSKLDTHLQKERGEHDENPH